MSLLKVAGTTASSGTLYVDSVFSTWLYTGNGSTQTITNGIDLAGKGGLVWIKGRTDSINTHVLQDTINGNNYLSSDTTNPAQINYNNVTAFNSAGFSIGAASRVNSGVVNFASWTFRKAAKFFDVVTWTGDGVDGRSIAHNLGVSPGIIIIKRTDSGSNWKVSLKGIYNLCLNLTNGEDTTTFAGGVSGSYTSTTFNLYSYSGIISSVNASGGTYVAYLFAHDTDADGIIQCGSCTGSAQIELGWEPQYLLIKAATTTDSWQVYDTMRGWTTDGNEALLTPNTSNAEVSTTTPFRLNATGFKPSLSVTDTYIYMAIRMPNKPPTSGSQVFEPVIRAGTDSASGNTILTSFAVDLLINKNRNSAVNFPWVDRLRGFHQKVTSNNTSAEATMTTQGPQSFNNTDIPISSYGTEWNVSAGSFMEYLFKRAPGFFDVVCYTGNGTTQNINHNLTSSPELLIFADRTSSGVNFTTWQVVCSQLGLSAKGAWLCFTNAFSTSYANIITAATSTTFSLDSSYGAYTPNVSTHTYVAYLFATLAGISKVGSYTGNGSTGQAIACGFSAGARFVLIKRTDSTGDWYTFDSARGLTSGSSPYLLLNSTAAETTGNNGVYASTGGFTLATSAAGLNASGGTYIFLAVA